MASGKPIFLEKPMATTLKGAAAIVKAADFPTALFLQIGLQYRYKGAVHRKHFKRFSLTGPSGTIKTISMSEYRPPFFR